MKISEAGLNLIKSFESCKLKAYKCVSTEKYYTIGWGHYASCSIVDLLKKIGVDSSYINRAKIAKVNGIENYKGLAYQNSLMCNLLKKGVLIKP